MKAKHLLIPFMALACGIATEAAPVTVTMNAVSTTMSLTAKGSETAVEVGSPTNNKYSFDAPAGEYVLTAYATDGKTINGTIIISIADSDAEQEFAVITNTAYVTNKNDDNSVWTVADGDYTIDLKVNTREGVRQTVTVGESTTQGRNTFLALKGDSYNIAFIPSEAHQAEGYTTLYKNGTLTANVNVNGAIPKGEDYSITVPSDAELMIAMKFSHFVDFTAINPKSIETKGDSKVYTYFLAHDQEYNYRTWMKDGLTQGGHFKMAADKAKRPAINFTKDDYSAFDPKKINHDAKSNEGYETGDIFVNINPQGHLKLNVGDTFDAHAMRTWELTDNSTGNYFIEPDFHYTVVDLDGKPSTGVIEISNSDTSVSPWSQIKAVGNGTAIVLVTYDAIGVNFYNNAEKKPYLGGEYWGAIWPENTGVYVVTVGDGNTAINPNMTINEEYNKETLKLAGKYVDAEHDVFYYLDTEEGARYTFTPKGVDNITIAYPVIGKQTVSYHGFGSDGVTKNEDGSYTLLLKHGRQIVKMTDASGKSAYQVLTAKSCHREIINTSREGSKIFQPGDKVKIQYSGLFHPANKIAGIYNMSAFVTYNGIPNGTSLILGANQYNFGSTASAQAVTIDIPQDHNVIETPEIIMNEGVIQVKGFGDPIGNHRTISPLAGRSPNFTAASHKTYFGAIPDVRIPLSAYKEFAIKLQCEVEGADISMSFNGKGLTPDDNGAYTGTYGTYSVTASKSGYRCYHHDFLIDDDAEGQQTFVIEMVKDETAWDGKTLTEPEAEDGVYLISNGAELAWLANSVNSGNAESDARLTNDIDLGDYPWTPIGSTSAKAYKGSFEGNGYAVKGLYINAPKTNYLGLFAFLNSGSISGITVYGQVSGKQYVAGVVANMQQNSTVDRCANYADITGSSTYVGGITGYLSVATAKVSNSYNVGTISGTTNCGGVAGSNNATAIINNVFNVGEILGTKVGACIGGTTVKTNATNVFATAEYQITDGQTLVTDDQMRSGEIAYKLGEAFGQEIGVDEHPFIGGMKVLYNETDDSYYNENGGTTGIDSITITDGENEADVVYYNLEGVPSAKPYKGFNIIRKADGTTTKVFIP